MKEIRNRFLYSGSMFLKRKFKREFCISIHFRCNFYFVRCLITFSLLANFLIFYVSCVRERTMSVRLRVSVTYVQLRIAIAGSRRVVVVCVQNVRTDVTPSITYTKVGVLNHQSQYNLLVHTALNTPFHYKVK